MNKEELQELFCTKIGLENTRFRQRMLNQKPEIIFERAYQIDTMKSIYELLLEESQEIKETVLKKLIVFPNLLAFLYSRWLKREDSHTEELHDVMKKEVLELNDTYEKLEEEEKEKKTA